ncbi:MAG: DUF5915 domain-containing protein [Acidimicrobiales bacterium]
MVTIDTEVTPALAAEGLARDIVREIQNARKAEDLVVTDRIRVWVEVASRDALAALDAHRAYVAEQVLAESVVASSRRRPPHPRRHRRRRTFRFTLAVTPSGVRPLFVLGVRPLFVLERDVFAATARKSQSRASCEERTGSGPYQAAAVFDEVDLPQDLVEARRRRRSS